MFETNCAGLCGKRRWISGVVNFDASKVAGAIGLVAVRLPSSLFDRSLAVVNGFPPAPLGRGSGSMTGHSDLNAI